MKTILVTGGGSGIGGALAERFVKNGARVIICGRRESALKEVQARIPGLETLAADLANESERVSLVTRALERFPALDTLVNNAGIQRRARFASDESPWSERREEIAINLEAPLHLTQLLLPHFKKQPSATIVNVSSGLAFVPALFAPVYAATKAALHSFTFTLRLDLASTNVKVIELIPPAVDTDLGGKGIHTQGVPLSVFIDSVFPRLLAGEAEVTFGMSEQMSKASRGELDAIAARMAGR